MQPPATLRGGRFFGTLAWVQYLRPMIKISTHRVVRAVVAVPVDAALFNQTLQGACLDEEYATLGDGGIPVQREVLQEYVGTELVPNGKLPSGEVVSPDILTFLQDALAMLPADATEILFTAPAVK